MGPAAGARARHLAPGDHQQAGGQGALDRLWAEVYCVAPACAHAQPGSTVQMLHGLMLLAFVAAVLLALFQLLSKSILVRSHLTCPACTTLSCSCQPTAQSCLLAAQTCMGAALSAAACAERPQLPAVPAHTGRECGGGWRVRPGHGGPAGRGQLPHLPCEGQVLVRPAGVELLQETAPASESQRTATSSHCCQLLFQGSRTSWTSCSVSGPHTLLTPLCWCRRPRRIWFVMVRWCVSSLEAMAHSPKLI